MSAAGSYAQLLALGLPWVAVHCGAMCGPVVGGLTAPCPSRAVRVRGLGAYQLGRLVVYAPLGAIAGALGHAIEIHPKVGVVAGLVLGGGLLAAALGLGRGPRADGALVSAQALVRRAEASRAGRSVFATARRLLEAGQVFPLGVAGFGLAALPCMLPAWVLGLAAASGSALHGALLMAVLLAMTTVPLAGFVLLLPAKGAGLVMRHAPRVALAVSGAWLVLGALASIHVVPHGRVTVAARTITLW